MQRADPHSFRFRVLGPLTAWRGNSEITIGSAKQRALLGLLLLGSGAPVPRQMIVDALWGSAAPASTVNLIHTYVGRLRRGLDPRPATAGGASWLVRIGSAYAIRAEDCELDLAQFRALAAHAARVSDGAERLDLLLRALSLWEEPGLSDHGHPLAGHPWVRRVEQERVDAVLAAAEVAAEVNRCAEVVPYLRDVAAAEPLNEAVHAWLMLCWAAAGSPAQALSAYEQVRRRLVDELGMEPGPQLGAAHERVLRHSGPAAGRDDTETETRPGPARVLVARPVPPGTAPALLPADLPDFTGRRDLLSSVRGRLTDPARQVLPVAVLAGEGGAGKSALAVHLGHELAPLFPDGQLYVEMTGTDGEPIDPGLALARLLRAVGVAADAVPRDPGERAGLYRSMLAGRRVLVVLDDLRDQSQLVPLLPGGPSCAVLGSSRAARGSFPGHQVVEVGSLDERDALALVAAIVGPDRVAQEPAAAAELVRLCDAMPLALRVAATRVAGRGQWTLDRMARRLGEPGRRLDELSVADLDVRAGLSREYEALDVYARSAFRCLGLLDAPSVAPWLAAACLDLPVDVSEELLDQLTDRRLAHFTGVDEAGQPRFRLRPLARVFARERASAEDGELIVRSTLTRTLAALVDRVQRVRQGTGETGPAGATAWLRSERGCIHACARQAVDVHDRELVQALNASVL